MKREIIVMSDQHVRKVVAIVLIVIAAVLVMGVLGMWLMHFMMGRMMLGGMMGSMAGYIVCMVGPL